MTPPCSFTGGYVASIVSNGHNNSATSQIFALSHSCWVTLTGEHQIFLCENVCDSFIGKYSRIIDKVCKLTNLYKTRKKPSAPGGGAKMIPPPGHQIWPYVTLPLTSDLMTPTVYRFMPWPVVLIGIKIGLFGLKISYNCRTDERTDGRTDGQTSGQPENNTLDHIWNSVFRLGPHILSKIFRSWKMSRKRQQIWFQSWGNTAILIDWKR